MAQCLDTGGRDVNPQLIPTAEENLMDALAVGFAISGYLNATPWASASKVLQHAETTAGSAWAHIPVLWVDVEIDGVTETIIYETCQTARDTGKAVGIYSARWFWLKLGNPQWPWLLEYDLWAADYDGYPDPATANLFGPWPTCQHKQYQNTTTVDGVDIDYDTFDLSIWNGGDDMGMTPEERAELDQVKADNAVQSEQIAAALQGVLTLSNQLHAPGGVWDALEQINSDIKPLQIDAIIDEIRERLEG